MAPDKWDSENQSGTPRGDIPPVDMTKLEEIVKEALDIAKKSQQEVLDNQKEIEKLKMEVSIAKGERNLAISNLNTIKIRYEQENKQLKMTSSRD